MADLQRITTEYLPLEDRVRLAGEVGEGEPVVLWLTQRLLQRLLPLLLRWLEPQGADPLRAEMEYHFTQEAARAAPAQPEPVRAPVASAGVVVESVDVEHSDDMMRLVFKRDGAELAELVLAAPQLRLWLGILHRAYGNAQWPLEVWPAWLRQGGELKHEAQGMLH